VIGLPAPQGLTSTLPSNTSTAVEPSSAYASNVRAISPRQLHWLLRGIQQLARLKGLRLLATAAPRGQLG
jgi:hypothetical protein